MKRQRVLDTFLDMVQIDSPSYHEAKMAHYCVSYLSRLGFSIRYDDSQRFTGSDTPQVIARKQGTAPGAIALSAHMDVVAPCKGVHPIVLSDRVTSDSETVLGADDKAGIAEIFEACESVIESGQPYPTITILLSVAEEQSVAGARYFPNDLFEERTLCLVMDASGEAGMIVTDSPYHYIFTAGFHGKAAHAGNNPEEGISAIQMAARAIDRMPLGRLDDITTASVGIAEGGRARNIIPDYCKLIGGCRSADRLRAEAQRDRMTHAMQEGARSFGGTVDISWQLVYPGTHVGCDDPDVLMLQEAARACGLTPRLAITGSGSDANVLGEKNTKPIALGCGMRNFHALTEYILLKDLEMCARFIEEVILCVA